MSCPNYDIEITLIVIKRIVSDSDSNKFLTQSSYEFLRQYIYKLPVLVNKVKARYNSRDYALLVSKCIICCYYWDIHYSKYIKVEQKYGPIYYHPSHVPKWVKEDRDKVCKTVTV